MTKAHGLLVQILGGGDNMDRRQFFGGTAAVATAVMAPRIFVRTVTEREGRIPNAKATVRLYDYGKLVIKQDIKLLADKTEAGMVFGKGQDILINGDGFSFDKCTISLAEFPMIEAELPLGCRHTITKGNHVTLEADPRGFVRIEDVGIRYQTEKVFDADNPPFADVDTRSVKVLGPRPRPKA